MCVCGEMACVCVCVRVRLWILPSACDLQNVTHSKRPSKLSSGLIPPPAATTRAAAPSAVSGHCGESRAPAERAGPPAATTRAAAPSAVSGHCAGHCGESRAPSGDNARHSPFWREQSGPFCSLWSAERAGPPAATTRAAAPSAVSGHCAGHCGESRAPSGDNACHSPFWSDECPFCSLWSAPATADVRCDKKGE